MTRSEPTARAGRRGGPGRAALVALALAGLACERAPEPAASWPAGAVLVGRSAALSDLLAKLSQLEGTPLGREARAWSAALPGCEWIEAHAEQASLAALRAGLRCADPAGPLSAVHRDRGERDLVFGWPLGEGSALGSAAVSAAGDLDLRVALPGDAFRGPRALLRPGDAAPGPPVLGGGDALLHARLRPADGIDLASLVESGGQGETLFALKSRLFGAAILDGTWELALYLPGEGESLPRAALALGTRERGAAVAAATTFLDEIEARWPVHRAPFALGAASGACLPELRMLPGLSPCWVATERALVVGWNAASLRKALDGSPPGLPDAGGLVAEFGRLPLADARMAAPALPLMGARSWPWSRLVAEPMRAGSSVELHMALAGASGA
jgi:hypothetical protein